MHDYALDNKNILIGKHEVVGHYLQETAITI